VGPGIPDEARKTLFDNFTQVAGSDGESSRRARASASRSAARSYRGIIGHIAFDTQLGKGSTFYFELRNSRPTPRNTIDRANVA
jgi:signal transduction histidine kinase